MFMSNKKIIIMVKFLFQSLVIWLGGTWVYKKSPLDDRVVDNLIEADKIVNTGVVLKRFLRKKDMLFDYISKYRLKPYQVTNILRGRHSKELVKSIVLNYELSEEQEEFFNLLGGCYTSEELDEFMDIWDINDEIARILKEHGVTHYLYENEEYIDEIRKGTIIHEYINIDEIKASLGIS